MNYAEPACSECRDGLQITEWRTVKGEDGTLRAERVGYVPCPACQPDQSDRANT